MLVTDLTKKYPHHLHHVLTLAQCCIAPVVTPPPPLNLLTSRLHLVMRRRLLSTSSPGCLLFAGWLSCHISSCVTFCRAASSHVHPLPPAFICTRWLLHCISSRCLCLLSSHQHPRLLTCCHLTSPICLSCSPQLVAVLPHVAPPPHIC